MMIALILSDEVKKNILSGEKRKYIKRKKNHDGTGAGVLFFLVANTLELKKNKIDLLYVEQNRILFNQSTLLASIELPDVNFEKGETIRLDFEDDKTKLHFPITIK